MKSAPPKGWSEPALSSIADLVMGQSPPSDTYNTTGKGLPFFQGKAEFGDLYPTAVKFCSKPGKVAQPGDILISVRAPVGPTNLCREKSCIGRGLAAVRAREGVSNQYLLFYLRSIETWLAEQGTGSTFTAISKRDLADLRIPLAPPEEQDRIVSKLVELLSRVRECEQRLAKVPILIKRLREAVIATACSGRLTANWRGGSTDNDAAPTGWRLQPLEDLLPRGGIFDGPFGSNLKSSDYTAAGVRVIRLENVGRLRFIADKETFVSAAKYETLTKHTVRPGDIIFASFVSDEIRACLVPDLSDTAIAKADCFCIRPRADLVDREYLLFQLTSQYSHDALLGEIHGATRPRINTKQLRRLQIRICPLPEQREIVRRTRELLRIVDEVERGYNEAVARLRPLRGALLAKAFSGELVLTDAGIAGLENFQARYE